MHRIPRLNITELAPDQERLMKSIIGGKRSHDRVLTDFTYADGSLRGPFNPWLHSPEMGENAQKLGESLRFASAIPPTLRELAIICVAVHWRAQYEWWAHKRIALKEGLSEQVVDAIMAGDTPPETEPGVGAVTAFVRELLTTGRVSDPTYAKLHKALGDRGTVDLVALVGYYGLVSATLNVFQIPMPDGEAPPFDE
jgi:4-carboxymuconolactone decarboxylase